MRFEKLEGKVGRESASRKRRAGETSEDIGLDFLWGWVVDTSFCGGGNVQRLR
jgi:hypothetical protein